MRCAIVVTYVLLGLVEAESSQPGDKTPKICAQSEWNRRSTGGPGKVVRNAAELVKVIPPLDAGLAPEAAEKEVVAAAAKALKVNDIDWKTQMVVVLSGGDSSNTGVKTGFTRPVVHDGTLTIHGSIRLPGVIKRTPPGSAHMTLIGLVDRFDGPVTFKMEKLLSPEPKLAWQTAGVPRPLSRSVPYAGSAEGKRPANAEQDPREVGQRACRILLAPKREGCVRLIPSSFVRRDRGR